MKEALMKHVERIVRPVRAGKVRKLAMRRELLAQLTAIFEEEAAKTADESAALAAAKARFGDPAVLTRELDRAIPWHARLAADSDRLEKVFDWLGWRISSPWWRFAVGASAGIAALHATIGVLLWLFVVLAPAGWHDPIGIPLSFRFLFYSMFGEFLFLLTVRAVYLLAFRSSWPWRWLGAVGVLAGASAVTVAAAWVFLWQVTGDIVDATSRTQRMALIWPIEVVIVVSLGVLAIWYGQWREAPYREWSRLELDN